MIRPMEERDRRSVIDMMTEFYSSPAVYTDGSPEIFEADVTACVGDCPFLEGYILEENGHLQGYAMVAKSFSTEFGKRCIWIEDVYVKEEYRGLGLGSHFLAFIEGKYLDAILRLEVEEDNECALHVYKKRGFDVLPYMEMKK